MYSNGTFPALPPVSTQNSLELRDRESVLMTQLKLFKDSASVVPSLEAELECKARQLHDLSCRVAELEAEKHKFVEQQERLKAGFDKRVAELTVEIQQLNQSSCNSDVNNNNNKLSGVKGLGSFRKTSSFSWGIMKENVAPQSSFSCGNFAPQSIVSSINEHNAVKLDENLAETTDVRVPRVPKPPPKRCFSAEGPKLTNPVSGPPLPPPPPPPSALNSRPPLAAIPPPPPPPLPGGVKLVTAKVKRMPEVVEFYHSVVRRDSRQDSVVGVAETTVKANARDLVGEIEKRSVYLHAIKKDVEIQGEFIRFLIKEVETAAFTDIRDMVSLVKWLDEELS